MQTFRISKVQEQSYYAIRIFGIVHLIAAVGLVVLLDGPSDGLRGLSWLLILLLLFSSAYLMLRIFQARAGRIHGHYVVTRNTLAIKLPGRPRVFVRRCDCTELLPGHWELRIRGGGRVSLRSASWGPYRREFLAALCQTWWPEFAGATIWTTLQDFTKVMHKVRILTRGGGIHARPILVFTPGRSLYMWHFGIFAAAVMCACCFAVGLHETWKLANLADSPIPGVISALNVLATFIVCVGWGTMALYMGCRMLIRRALRSHFVLTGHTMAKVRSHRATEYFPERQLAAYRVRRAELVGWDGRVLALSPYLLAEAPVVLLRCVWAYWRPDRTQSLDFGLLTNISLGPAVAFQLFVLQMLTFGGGIDDTVRLAREDFQAYLIYYMLYAGLAVACGVWMWFSLRVALMTRVDLGGHDEGAGVVAKGKEGAGTG